MRILVAGIRYLELDPKAEYTDYSFVKSAIVLSGFVPSEIVSGNAIGVDRLGERYASSVGLPLKIMPADWNAHGKAAGHIRNKSMAEYCDAAVIIWDGKSKGTYNMIQNMIKTNKPYFLQIIETGLDDFFV